MLNVAAVPVPSAEPGEEHPPPPTHVVTVHVAAALTGEEEGGGVIELLGVPLGEGVPGGVAPSDSVALGVGDAEAPGQERKRTRWLVKSPKKTVPLTFAARPPTPPKPGPADAAQPSTGADAPLPASVVTHPEGSTRRKK
jgi:hypothetical protein